ncbi:period circadian protein-like isoform X2 [Uloborus diversus]|uniref:period circadian protein-like isoform X2 n=1 Tax=Uloborus diversus TaxID=327109 RepID=UPI002409C27D|nr:period circadian protein-like isoform X2 [Uloborus diversus]
MKSLINLDDDSNVTDISPVLTCIRSLSDSEAIWDKDKKGLVTSLSLKQLKNETDTLREDGFIFAVSLRDGSCLYTSRAISLYLGYPKDMWIGQCVMNFIYHKDHITFANYLTQGLNACFMQVKREDAHLFVNTFFCRLRLYQGLKFGYSVKDQKQQYKPFKITFHLNEMLLDDICVEKSAATLCVKATATQVTAGYTTPEEIPAMTSFSTRHTASCHFSHVDVSAIPYLGYLPQDMIGNSIFDFYHTDDMPQLKDIYELVVKEHGTSFRSKPYRFKVQNSCYILLETEWSCFINPWSHKLEFVVGQHRVLKGPTDINIFTPCEFEETVVSDEIVKESRRIQKEIKTLLAQTIQTTGNARTKRFCSKRKRDLVSFVYSCVDEGFVAGSKHKGNGDKADQMDDKSNSDSDSVVMGDISPYRELSDSSVSSETPPTVQQLRYQDNIERFFASQPKTYSDESEEYNRNEKCSSGEGYQASSSGSGNASGKESGGNASKEPSNSSKSEKKNQESVSNSSKCNISSACDSGYGKSLEKKDRDNHNNSNEGSSNEGWKTSANETANRMDKLSSCAALTEESLVTHNRISNKHLKHHQRKNKNSLGIPTKDNWFYQKGPHHHKHKKGPHNVVSTPTQTDATNAILAPGSVTPISEHTSSTQLTSQSCMANNYVGSTHTPTPFFIPVYMGSVPCYPPMSSMHLQTSLPFWSCASGGETNSKDATLSATISTEPVNFANSIKNANKLAPCLTPNQAQFAGIPFSILQPSEVSLQANTADQFKSCVASDVKISENQEGEDAENKFEDKTEPIECDMLVDESRSSYFTQSSSFQSVDKEEEMEFETKKAAPHPSRSEREELDSEIAFRYRMEVHQMEDILKKDLEALKSMQQPDPVNRQLQMLQDELKEMSEDKNMQKGDFFMSESSLLGLITEDDVNEELDHREDYLLQLMCEDS